MKLCAGSRAFCKIDSCYVEMQSPPGQFSGKKPYKRLRVDSLTTNSGATLRWVALISRFSSTPLMPSNTTPTADAPIASMGCWTVVSDGVYRAEVATSGEHNSAL